MRAETPDAVAGWIDRERLASRLACPGKDFLGIMLHQAWRRIMLGDLAVGAREHVAASTDHQAGNACGPFIDGEHRVRPRHH